MDKSEVYEAMHKAIIEVSPFACNIMRDHLSSRDKVHFVDLGINSIDYAQIASIVMEQLKINYPLDIFAKTNSIYEAVEILYQLAMKREETVDLSDYLLFQT